MIATPFFKSIAMLEKLAGFALGKGYGATTVLQEVKSASKLIRGEPALLIDIGGNIGDYTSALREKFPLACIYTFEPAPNNIQKLRDRFANDEFIKIIPLALSDRNTDAVLYSDFPGSGLGSLTKRRLDHFNIKLDTESKILAIRFEDFWRSELKQQPIDFVKLDIEGHEFGALQGFGSALQKTKLLQFEFGGGNIDTKTYFQDFFYYLRQHSFELYRISPLGLIEIKNYSERDEVFATTNYLAKNTFL